MSLNKRSIESDRDGEDQLEKAGFPLRALDSDVGVLYRV